jgi:DNA-binding HxlR family transcriptional regulator
MYEKKIPKDFSCGMAILMEIIGGKWKSYLIFLINQGIRRPSALHKAMPSASRRVLDMHLRELEFHEIIERKIYAELPLKVEYFITDFGETLLPIIRSMEYWGDTHKEKFREIMEKKVQQNDMSTLTD